MLRLFLEDFFWLEFQPLSPQLPNDSSHQLIGIHSTRSQASKMLVARLATGRGKARASSSDLNLRQQYIWVGGNRYVITERAERSVLTGPGIPPEPWEPMITSKN